MNEPRKVLTVLRGAQLREAPDAAPAPLQPVAREPQPPAGETIYGIPASAVQHCCGRACRHCQVYWHGKRKGR